MQANVAKSLPRSLSVRSKLIVAFVSLTFVAVATVSWIGYVSARTSLREASERQLLGLQRSKAAMVKATLDSARNEVLSLAASSILENASTELRAAYRQLEREPVTPEMKAEVERFYKEEFEPALMKKSSLAAPEGSLLPSSNAGLYLHYHYMARAPKPYGMKRLNQSAADHSAYAKAVAKYLPELEAEVGRLGLENITLVDPETMEVFFTIEQSTVLGTNLVTGPYSGTNMANLGRVLAKSQNEGDYKVADFEMYRPALGSPKAFIGTPVFDGPRVIAVMILRIPNDQIASILSGNESWAEEGLGKSGEVYLLGPDQTMRTDSRFLIENRAAFIQTMRRSTLTSGNVDKIEKLGTTILTVPVKHEAAVAALRGETGLMRLNDYRGVPSLMAYGPIDLDSVRWAVIAKIDEAEAMAPLHEYAIRVLVWGVGLSLLATVMALAAAHTLTRPISALVKAAKRVSQGALDVEVEVVARDEYREFGEVFNEMVANLRISRHQLQHQVMENERLLMSLLPASGAAQVREGNAEARQSFKDVTVAFVNFSGFETLPADLGETDSMALLSDVVAACDEAAEQYGIEKVRTIGSSYLAVSGLSVERPDHTALMVQFASEVVRIVKRFNAERGVTLVAEIGINAGPVIGGLVGRRKFIYDLWGDTVKLARGIESDGRMSILVTRPVYDRVRDLVTFGAATSFDVRGMGRVELFSLLDEAAV
jgi:class 3 adenylate cyclase